MLPRCALSWSRLSEGLIIIRPWAGTDLNAVVKEVGLGSRRTV